MPKELFYDSRPTSPVKPQDDVGQKAGEVITNELGMKFAWIPPGTFMMGSPESEEYRNSNETSHKVIITKGFYLGIYTVTQEQWEGLMENNPSGNKGAKLPVHGVSWEDCQEFIKKLNAKTNGGYRLPTEAEWEYACRAGTTTAYSFGDNITPKDANYASSILVSFFTLFVFNSPKAVGSYKSNAFGLYDMHGNVEEWCEDWYGDYYSAGVVTDPKGTVTGEYRILRGGSCDVGGSDARSSYRNSRTPTGRFFSLSSGFRLAWTK
jgi:formylglycine-generating enzyme required for sulfatase activity